MHQRVSLFKATGKRSGGHLGTTVKKLKDNVSRVGAAPDGTGNGYRPNLEDEHQDASNELDILKESTFQMENTISEEVVKKRAVRLYLSLHVNFRLSTDVTFLTNPPAVLSTYPIEVYGSSDVHDALNSIYENLPLPTLSNMDLDGFWNSTHFELLHTFPFLHVYRTGKK